MYDYMQALQDRFFDAGTYAGRQEEIEAMRRRLSQTLDKQRRKQLLQIVDAESLLRDDMTLASFIAGFRLACGIANDMWYSGEEQLWNERRDT